MAKRILALILALCMVLSLASCDSSSVSLDEYNQVISERDEARAEVEALKAQLALYENDTDNTSEETVNDFQVDTTEPLQEETESGEDNISDFAFDSAAIGENNATIGEKNALSSAENYLSIMAFSYSGLVEQLKYEGYSDSEAIYAAENCNADWKEQAAKKAQEYMSGMAFSRSALIEQLEYEGFTEAQAEYGASAVGY